jgi:uncharacterized protein
VPIIKSEYKPPFYLTNSHLQTIIPSLFRMVKGIKWQRERITTPDNDFIDMDWSVKSGDKLAIIFHGLESSSERAYVRGMAKKFNEMGWSAVAMNFRGCSGEANKLFRSYHSGSSDDIKFVVDYILNKNNYKQVVLIGFSLGGNAMLKYLGETAEKISEIIKAAIAISVPCDLSSSAKKLALRENYIYMKRFINKLRVKLLQKHQLYPEMIDINRIHSMFNFKDVDDLYTAPAHGYKDAEEYYLRCSSLQFLNKIKTPTLILNAADDPFLSTGCFPVKEAEENKNLFLEVTPAGGHVGFKMKNGEYRQEKRAVEFVGEFVNQSGI